MNSQKYKDLLYHVAFSHADGIGPATFKKMLNAFPSLEEAYTAPAAELSPYFLTPQYLQRFLYFRKKYQADRTLDLLITKDIQILSQSLFRLSDYSRLIPTFPICLYAKGTTALLTSGHIKIAIIGTRKPTPYGTQNTQNFTRELIHHNAIILSGLALGIDALAHQTALDYEGKTIAILGSGFHHVHPRQNLRLYNSIIDAGGLVLTEYPPDTPPCRQNFPIRNRLISGFSRAVLVIEGSAHSGTRITANHALNSGIDVFAIPGPIDAPLSQTPNYLIQQGAYLVDSPQYIIDKYELKKAFLAKADPLSHNLIKHLSQTPATASDLAAALRISINLILPTLTRLELTGHIRKQNDSRYALPVTIHV